MSGAILGKYTHIAPETIAKMQRAQFALTLDPAMLQPVIDVSAQFGVIPKPFPATEIIAKLSLAVVATTQAGLGLQT